MTGASDDGATLVMVGEVRTGLLMNRLPLEADAVAELLDLVPGERVRTRERPVPRAVSPDTLYGVDCPLVTRSGGRVRAIGTLAARACVVGGRVVQGSTRGVLIAGGDRRLPWSHYLECPGVVELTGRGTAADVATRFLSSRDPESLDPGAVSEAQVARLRAARLLDHRPPFHPRRTRLRWSAVVDREGFRGAFTLADRELRTLRLTIARTAQATPEQLAALCEDVALHDWLLTTVPAVVDSACGTRRGDADHGELRVVIDQLLHLWMPGTDTPPGLGEIWDRLEARPGLTRQWSACVRRVRDHLALRTLELLQDHRAARPPG